MSSTNFTGKHATKKTGLDAGKIFDVAKKLSKAPNFRGDVTPDSRLIREAERLTAALMMLQANGAAA